MLAGQRPFQRKTTVETLNAIINEPMPPLVAQPHELQDILDKAIAKDPKERYQHAGDFSLDLRRFGRALEGKSLRSFGNVHTAPRRGISWLIGIATASSFCLQLRDWFHAVRRVLHLQTR